MVLEKDIYQISNLFNFNNLVDVKHIILILKHQIHNFKQINMITVIINNKYMEMNCNSIIMLNIIHN